MSIRRTGLKAAAKFIKTRFPRERKTIKLGDAQQRKAIAEDRKKFLSEAPRTSEGKIIKQIPDPYPVKQAKKEQFLGNPSKKKVSFRRRRIKK